MSADYSKKKNAELEDLLKARSLPHTGKKAELIDRLKKYDAEQEAAKAAPAEGAEDEIDWEDDAAVVATDPPAAAAISAGGLTQPPNPTAVPNQKPAIDPSKTSDLTVVDPPAPTTSTTDPPTTPPTTEPTSAPKTDYATNLPPTHLDAELSKRKARALRFGITESTDDALKALERAKKFGTGDAGDKAAVRGLDEALPERMMSRKRGRGGGGGGGNDDAEEGGKGRQGKRSKVRGNPPRGRRERSGTPGKKAAAGGDRYNEADRKRAEERKKRFAN